TLVDAWALVSEELGDSETRLLLIGGGADEPVVRERIRERRLTNVVWVNRHVHANDRLAELLSAADVYAFSSRHEGFPVAPIEAMGCGLPVVATSVSGIEEVLSEGNESGGVVVPVDDPAALAAGMRWLLGNQDARRRLGESARARAQAFGIPEVGRALRAFLD